MNINIICLGKIKEKYLQDAINEYLKRISKYAEIKVVELPDEPILDNPSEKEIEKIKQKEALKILKTLGHHDYNIALDLRGKQITSPELSAKFNDITTSGYSTINFIIGGTCGLTDEIVNKSDFVLSFSKFTFPHQLMRLILLEQIFRSFKILNNEKYHW